jgi:hypothetical protein
MIVSFWVEGCGVPFEIDDKDLEVKARNLMKTMGYDFKTAHKVAIDTEVNHKARNAQIVWKKEDKIMPCGKPKPKPGRKKGK